MLPAHNVITMLREYCPFLAHFLEERNIYPLLLLVVIRAARALPLAVLLAEDSSPPATAILHLNKLKV